MFSLHAQLFTSARAVTSAFSIPYWNRNAGAHRIPESRLACQWSQVPGSAYSALEGALLSQQSEARRLGGCSPPPGENAQAFSALCRSVAAQFQPQTEIEVTLVQCMIAAQWRLRRIWALEQAALLYQSSTTVDPNPVATPEGTWSIPAARTAAAFQSVHGRSGSGSIMHMAETRYQRQLSQALQQFRAIRGALDPTTTEPEE